ncbi:hypothetical protein [Mycobacterium sp.]|uniref:hypothetical protein n=1 Tax=Mycobacterium sp. TaxID=1785 RepID=UPI00333F5E18
MERTPTDVERPPADTVEDALADRTQRQVEGGRAARDRHLTIPRGPPGPRKGGLGSVGATRRCLR